MTTHGKILITGASGFVGSAVTHKLVEAGYCVRALVRGRDTVSTLVGLDIEFVKGDIRDRQAVNLAMTGVRYVFHVAADYRLWAPNPQEIFVTNIDGTRNVMEAALDAGVERIVHTSSVATIALRHGGIADESVSLSESEALGAYKRSKIAAERLVDWMVTERGLPAVIVNPSTPIGPRDARPTPTGRIIVEAAKGRIPVFVDTGLNLVHVDDVASGHLAALRSGKIGERYILGGENVLFSQMLKDIAGIMGHHAPWMRLPWRALVPVALAAEGVAAITGREPFATLDGLYMARDRMFFASTKAEQELSYRFRPYIQGIEEALHWFRAAGHI
jgi:dihydroflavonol-4-reductase